MERYSESRISVSTTVFTLSSDGTRTPNGTAAGCPTHFEVCDNESTNSSLADNTNSRLEPRATSRWSCGTTRRVDLSSNSLAKVLTVIGSSGTWAYTCTNSSSPSAARNDAVLVNYLRPLTGRITGKAADPWPDAGRSIPTAFHGSPRVRPRLASCRSRSRMAGRTTASSKCLSSWSADA